LSDKPSDAMRAWEAARPRSQKTARARAEGKWGVGPSDLSACEKAIEFRENPPEGHVPIDIDKSAAILGTLTHESVTKARKARYPWRMFKVGVPVPGLDVPGEADEFDPHVAMVTDYKTAGRWRWDKVGKEGPAEYDWEQLLLYGLGLEDAGLHVEWLELLFISRESGQWEPFRRRYSREAALRTLTRLLAIVEALDEGRPLPRRRAGDDLLGPTVNGLCASHCPHVKTCWGLDEVPAHRSPESWLLVRDNPAVAATLERYDAARGDVTERKKEQEYARTLLTGVDPGRYGDMTLAWSGGNLGDPQPDLAARVTQLEQAMQVAFDTGEPPPDPGALEMPTSRKQSAVSIQVKRVRAAQLEAEGAVT
jgi:hypothetical protein